MSALDMAVLVLFDKERAGMTTGNIASVAKCELEELRRSRLDAISQLKEIENEIERILNLYVPKIENLERVVNVCKKWKAEEMEDEDDIDKRSEIMAWSQTERELLEAVDKYEKEVK